MVGYLYIPGYQPIQPAAHRAFIVMHVTWMLVLDKLIGTNAYMFYRFFFLSATTKCINMRQLYSGTAERIFMKLLKNDRGEWSFQRSTQMGARPQ